MTDPAFEGLLSATEYIVSVMEETEYGKDPFPADAATIDNFLSFEEFTITPEVGIVQDETVRAVHSGYADQRYGDKCTVSWTKPITGKADAAGDPPLWAPLLKSSNFEETITADTDVKYMPITGVNMDRVPSSAYAFFMPEQERENARLMKVLGCRGNRTISLEMGQVAKISGDDTGLYAPFPTDTIAIPANPAIYEGSKAPLLVVGLNFVIGGDVYQIEQASFQTNWNIYVDQDATTADTITSHVALHRARGERIGGEVQLKGRVKTITDIVSKINVGDDFTIAATLTDGTDTLVIDSPAAQFGNYTENRDGHLKFGVPFFCSGTGAGENELGLTFS